jgi:hypothetical protein
LVTLHTFGRLKAKERVGLVCLTPVGRAAAVIPTEAKTDGLAELLRDLEAFRPRVFRHAGRIDAGTAHGASGPAERYDDVALILIAKLKAILNPPAPR